MKFLTAIFTLNLLLLLLIFSSILYAQNKNPALSSFTHGVNIPLYLSLIEFSPLDSVLVEKVQRQLQKKKKFKLQENIQLKPFHQRNNSTGKNNKNTLKDSLATSNLSFCSICHLPLPHQKNARSRSFNNMHSRYIACETCHLDTVKLNQQLVETVDSLEYRWFDFVRRSEAKNIEGIFNDQNMQSNLLKKLKITPFYKQQAVVISRSHLYSKMLEENWKTTDLYLKAEIKVRTHLYIKEQGETCAQCHKQKGSLLELMALGASKKQLQMFSQNSIANFFSRYSSPYKGDAPIEKNASTNAAEKQEKIQRIRITDLLN